MKYSKKTMVLVPAVLAAVGCAIWYGTRTEKQVEQTTKIYVVSRKTTGQRDVVRARGMLFCADSIPVMAGIHGRLIELMPQGSRVKKGDKLLAQEDTEAREEIENQEMEVQDRELELVRLEAQYQLADFQESQDVALSDARLKHAELEERLELAEPDARDRRVMELEEQLAKLDVEDAEDEYEREQRMFSKGYISESALEPYEQRRENAATTLEETLLKNELTRKGATEERRVELRMNVQRVAHKKMHAERHRERRIGDILTNKRSQERRKALAVHKLKYHEEELNKASVYAPMDGVFMVQSNRDWSLGGVLREVSVGDEEYPLDLVGQVINLSNMEVKMVVNEADYHRLKPNLPVEIQMPAVPGRVFKGRLKRLGAIGRDRNRVDPTSILSGDSEVSMFSTLIELEGEGVVFHPGMSAMVTIIVDDGTTERLLIPRAAVTELETGEYTVTLGDGTSRKIKGDYYNEQYFQVEEGVAEGDELSVSIFRGVL